MPEPNELLRGARERTESPRSPGQPLSRAELAEQVNAWIYDNTRSRRVAELDGNYVGKLERGVIRWPQEDYRTGLRAVLGVRSDTDLGFRRPRRSLATVANVDRKDFMRAALGVTAGAIARPISDLLSTREPAPVPPFVGPEFLPSSLYFDLDRTHGIAAAALLLIDSTGHSHQWLTQGNQSRDDVVLVMDPHNSEYARFPQESYIPTVTLYDIVTQWAFGDNLPSPSVSWRTASEDEVGWPAGAGY